LFEDLRQRKTPSTVSGVWHFRKKSDLPLLRGFDNFARFNASRAHLHSAIAARRKLYANGLQVRIEPTARFVVSV